MDPELHSKWNFHISRLTLTMVIKSPLYYTHDKTGRRTGCLVDKSVNSQGWGYDTKKPLTNPCSSIAQFRCEYGYRKSVSYQYGIGR